MTTLTLLTRTGCHLCEEMKRVIETVQRTHPLTLREVDIMAQPELERRFGTEIPVLLRGDDVIARHRITPSQLAEQLTR